MNRQRALSLASVLALLVITLTASLLVEGRSARAPDSLPGFTPGDDCGTLSGIISADTELPEDCVYTVTGQVLVQTGVTLTIHPGVSLRFQGPYYLRVDGRLLATGTSDKRITFTSGQADPAPGDWVSIALRGTEQSVISWATVEYGGKDIGTLEGAVHAENGPHLIENTVFRKNGPRGAAELVGHHTVQNSLFTENEGGAVFAHSGASDVLTNTFTGNVANGIVTIISGITDNDEYLIQGNHFEDNTAVGVVFLYYTSPSRVLIRRNTFVHNHATASEWPGVVKLDFSSSAAIECNLFWGNQVSGSDPQRPGGVIMVTQSHMCAVTVSSNDIYTATQGYDLDSYSYLPSPEPVYVTGNYWATTEASNIAQRVHDFHDDFSLPEVIYEPFLVSPAPCVPLLAPAASFTTSSPDRLGQSTVFTNTTTVIPPDDPTLIYLWSFGDSVTSTVKSPYHTYGNPGQYTVTLTATSTAGSDVALGTVIVLPPLWRVYLPLVLRNSVGGS